MLVLLFNYIPSYLIYVKNTINDWLRSEGNALDAAAQAAAQGFVLIGNIIANIIAVIAFVAFLNAIINWLGTLVGQDELSFEVTYR